MQTDQKKPDLPTAIEVTIVCEKGQKNARWVINGAHPDVIRAQKGDVLRFRIEPPQVASAMLTSSAANAADGGSPFGGNPIDLMKNDYQVTVDSSAGTWSFAIAISIDGALDEGDAPHEALFPELEVGSHFA